MRFYNSTRVARYHPAWRGRDAPPLPPKYQVVRGYPFDCACPSHLAIVGEGPGTDEDQADGPDCGVPFVGRSGEDLDRYLTAHNIDPDTAFLTNIGRIYRVGNPDPTQEDIETWEPLLHEELNRAQPWYIASVGRIATRYFLGDVDMDTVHGTPFLTQLPWLDNGRGGRVVVVPLVHPAAGFRSTEAQAQTAYDVAQLALALRGALTPRPNDSTADRYPNPDYQDLTNSGLDLARIGLSLAGGTRSNPMPVAIDTEGLPGNPWGLSYSVAPGTAFVIRGVHKLALMVFYRALIEGISEGRLHVILHNSLHDLRVLRELGIPIPDGSYTDTMVLAYHLCIEPQGLKQLAFRHAGMEMNSYDEVISDAQDRIAVDYYETIEGLVAGGVDYAVPGRELLGATVKILGPDATKDTRTVSESEFETEEAARKWVAAIKLECHEAGLRTKANPIRKIRIKPSQPTGVGPFAYIEPYTLLARNKETGQLEERVKKPQQIHQRINKALAEYRSGDLTAAGLRKRWDGTDELVVDLVEDVIGEMCEAGLDDVPLERSIKYSARDADATLRIYPIMRERHWAMGLERVGQIDHAIIPMVDRMQEVGIKVDVDYLTWLSADLARRMLAVQEEIKAKFGVWINPNSGEQVADLLFSPVEEGGYGLEATKQTKGRTDKETGEIVGKRGSTQDKVLEGLRGAHPIIPLILDYRGLLKAKTSFCDVAIRKAKWERRILDDGTVDEGWFVHCNFRITRVSSGRLSATGPNLMAVVGGDLGQEIRIGYTAGEGFEFAEWDLNQVEMRVMASDSGDEFLLSMFRNDEDVHTGTADKMFKFGLSRPYKKSQLKGRKLASGVNPRDPAKRTGFGVITGIQPPGLVDQMRLQGIIISEDEAATWITDWLAACPAVPDYMQACHREARAYGYVRDWTGRIRYLPGINSPFRHIRAEAGRQSHSHKIQAGAQGIMKVAMATIDREVLPYWRAKGRYIEPVIQVHDSLMLRIRGFNKEEKDELDAQVRAAMFGSAPPGFKIPLDAGNGYAPTWGELEH